MGLAGSTAEESELLKSLRDGVRWLAHAEIRPLQIDAQGRIPGSVLSALAELGAFGLSIPEEFGGAGFSLQGVCSAVASLAELDRSVATTVGLHLGLGTRGLIAFGSEALRTKHLPELAAGRKIAAFAATEAGAGSDLAAIATRAVEIAPGRLRIDGTKIYVTNGGLAHLFTIAAATPMLGGARRGHSLILLEKADAGLTAAGEEHKLGLRGSSTTSLHLDGVEVPSGRIIGEPGRGMEQMHHVLAWGRTAMAAGCCGAAQTALNLAVAHVATRRQFGRPLAAFEVVRGQLAEMAALLFAMEALVEHTCAAQDDVPLLAARSRAAKIFCSEADWEVCDLAVQLHGGAGFIEETGLPLLLRDARITRIFEGANDVLLVAHGTAEVSAPTVLGSTLGERIASHRDELRARLGVKLLNRQRLLHRLGRLLVLREALEAAERRAEAIGTVAAHALALHFAQLVSARAEPLFTEPAPGIDAIARALTEPR